MSNPGSYKRQTVVCSLYEPRGCLLSRLHPLQPIRRDPDEPGRAPAHEEGAWSVFIDWLVSAEGQKAIAGYKIEGQQSFFAGALMRALAIEPIVPAMSTRLVQPVIGVDRDAEAGRRFGRIARVAQEDRDRPNSQKP